MGTRQTAPLDTTLGMETAEHISFRYQLAGPVQRLSAYTIDLIVRCIIGFFVILLVLISGAGGDWENMWGLELGVLLLLFFVLEWGYFVFFETLWHGTSPGKRALRLRVIRKNGLPVTFSDSLLRNLLRAADLLPTFYAIGGMTMLIDTEFRRLGDLVAKTLVVVEPRASLGEADARGTTPLLPGLPARPALRREEQAALALFHRRAPELSPARARELAEIWAPQLRARFGVPDADAVALLDTLHQRVQDS